MYDILSFIAVLVWFLWSIFNFKEDISPLFPRRWAAPATPLQHRLLVPLCLFSFYGFIWFEKTHKHTDTQTHRVPLTRREEEEEEVCVCVCLGLSLCMPAWDVSAVVIPKLLQHQTQTKGCLHVLTLDKCLVWLYIQLYQFSDRSLSFSLPASLSLSPSRLIDP